MESTVSPLGSFIIMLSPVLFKDGKLVTPIAPLNKAAVDVGAIILYALGIKIICGNAADVNPPSLSFQFCKSTGFAERLKISINSDSGRPTIGDGSAMNSLTIISFLETGWGTK